MKYAMNLLVVLLLTGCATYEPAVWIGGGPSEIAQNDSDQSIGLRAGLKGDVIEVGVSSAWFPKSQSPQTYGLYAIYHLPDPIMVADIESKVYVGAQIGLPELDLDTNDGAIAKGFCGVLLPYHSFIEVAYNRYSGDIATALNDKDEAQVTAGWRIPIK